MKSPAGIDLASNKLEFLQADTTPMHGQRHQGNAYRYMLFLKCTQLHEKVNITISQWLASSNKSN
jgi:hypothetical protein